MSSQVHLILSLFLFFEVSSLRRTIKINTGFYIWDTDEKFLSVALGSNLIAANWKNLDFHSTQVHNLAVGLSPCYMRLGGTGSDSTIFDPNIHPMQQSSESLDEKCTIWNETEECRTKQLSNITLTGKNWILLNNFTHKVGWSLVFGINALLREGQDWSTDNAKQLLKFSSDQGFRGITWELGNEPNAFYHKFHVKLKGIQLGKDFKALRRLLDDFPLYRNSSVVGPDINGVRKCRHKKPHCRALTFLTDVLKMSGPGVIDKVTWHQYYLNGRTARLVDFVNPRTLNGLQNQMNLVQRALWGFNVPVWLGETSSAYGGGAPGISDRYAASYLWLDKLGLAALNKYSVVIRQTFYHGSYALINEKLEPNPDYWVSLLYKHLVGKRVLRLEQSQSNAGKLRLYAHCSRLTSGGITIFGLNLGNISEEIILQNNLRDQTVQHYILSPPGGNLVSKQVLLNGRKLRLDAFKNLPEIHPLTTTKTHAILINPFEMSFWEFPNLNISLCTIIKKEINVELK